MADTIDFKCPNCGGSMEFDSAIQKMRCPYCDSVFTMEELQEKDEVLNEPAAPGGAPADFPSGDSMEWERPASTWSSEEAAQMGVYSCKSCGGEILADDTTGATNCPFCGNPVVLTSRFSGGLKPDLVLPFKLGKEEAKQALKKFMTGKRLLPKLFSSENHLSEIKGVYVPFWIYDAGADVGAQFRATRVRSWRSGNTEYTETSYYDVYRAGTLQFNGIPVDGSTKMPDDMMESLEPFHIDEAKPFQSAYLSGYLADRYDVSEADSMSRANARAKTTASQALAGTVTGYATVSETGSSVRITNGRARYALLPVWLLTTKYQGKDYQFAMNGQTGKFVGSMPIDNGAKWRWRLLYTGIIGAIGWAVLYGLSFFL